MSTQRPGYCGSAADASGYGTTLRVLGPQKAIVDFAARKPYVVLTKGGAVVIVHLLSQSHWRCGTALPPQLFGGRCRRWRRQLVGGVLAFRGSRHVHQLWCRGNWGHPGAASSSASGRSHSCLTFINFHLNTISLMQQGSSLAPAAPRAHHGPSLHPPAALPGHALYRPFGEGRVPVLDDFEGDDTLNVPLTLLGCRYYAQ